MNCLELRRALGADPHHASPESLAHRAECAACARYAQEMLRLNGLIKRALDVPIREGASRPSHTRWYALAASMVIALSVALWLSFPRTTLAKDVLAHMEHEPFAMTMTDARVSRELLEGALRAKGLRLAQPLDAVSYLQSCALRGDFVPHLVVQTPSGPVAALLLTQERVTKRKPFSNAEYRGVLAPLGRGGIAVIAKDDASVDAVMDVLANAIAWN